jgi:cell division protein FtsA
MEGIIFGLDIGTTKVCALVGEIKDGQLKIIGLGEQNAEGMRKGMIIDVAQATVPIALAIEQAEETSGYDLSQAYVSMAGEHISSTNNHGAIAIGKNGSGVTHEDVERALNAAQAISIPHNREIVHLVPRTFVIDDQEEVRSPIGLHGYRLEVEAHIVTAATAALKNLSQTMDNVGIRVEEFVLNALASAEAILDPSEMEMGVIIVDIGGGTADMALYKQGVVWHTKVIPVGGYHITNDIAIGLRVPFEVAEEIKLKYGDCRPDQIDPGVVFTVQPFGGEKIQVGRQDLAYVVEARVDEIFQLILQEIRRSGYEEFLPAGIVLTGGTAQMKGICQVAKKVLGVPARVAKPKKMIGLVESVSDPAHATSVGLLQWATSGLNLYRPRSSQGQFGKKIGGILKAILPD